MYKYYFIPCLILGLVLQLQHRWLITTDSTEKFEPSGLTMMESQLLTVSDNQPRYIFSLARGEEEFIQAKKYLALSTDFLAQYSKKNEFKLDLEGITFCNQRFYIADERNRNILEVYRNGEVRSISLDFAQYHRQIGWNPFSYIANAGFEAIACNREQKTLYLMNERMYRHVYQIDVKEEKIIDDFDVPAGERLPLYLKNAVIYPDYSGADFFQGYLYLLYRNEYKILKVNPQTRAIEKEAQYSHITKGLYRKQDPFGLAEGLAVTKQSIFLILDNNGAALKGREGNYPILLQFTRPDGF